MTYPDDYEIKELAGTTVKYRSTVKAIRTRVVPALDDEFAKDVGEFESLDALRGRIRQDLEHEMRHEVERDTRADLLRQLATRVTFDVPASLLDREIDRRVEEFVRRLIEQQIDPMKTNINWEEFRERQRDAAVEAVKGALVLDEVARREHVEVAEAEVEAEVSRYAERRAGRRRPCGPGSRRKAAWHASIRASGAKNRSISSSGRPPSSRRDDADNLTVAAFRPIY